MGQADEPEGGPSQTTGACPVVGIGASAGGIDALQKFLPALTPGSGMAFVVVQHLAPDQPSTLAEILQRFSPLRVLVAEDGMAVEPEHVYVTPPNASITIEDGRLHVATPAEPRGHRAPIDGFFISLAEDRGELAACVVLSGTGSDGTVGLRSVKEGGGLTLAQSGAEYDGMMRSALATGLVDLLLPAGEMPRKLADHFRHLQEVRQRTGPDSRDQEAAEHLAQICALLRARTGHDFANYKDKTVVRRVQRRMHVLQVDGVPAFIDRLKANPQEIDLLFRDLLIGVTSFFRDPAAFEALERLVIPRLYEGKDASDTIRAWVPGCATGEEAYSIAMLLRERMAKSHAGPRLQIFASDIDEHALEFARLGRYPVGIAKHVSAERLERHFVREDGTYRVIADLREVCLFSEHNLLHDAPFSKLDLISCRNLLIYLNADLQNRVIPLFHYALRDSGFLFLGTSENVTRHSRLFTTVDKANRIFQRRPHADRRLPQFPLTTPDGTRRRPASAARADTAEGSLRAAAESLILERYAPAYVLVNAEGEVLTSSGRTGKYLELPAGTPDTNIFSMARRGLRLELRAALHKAISTGQTVVQTNLSLATDGGRQTVDLHVQPLHHGSPQDTLCLVVFQDIGGLRPAPGPEPTTDEEKENVTVRQLETDLRATKERLQTTTEELESSNEELKSSNEELSSMNEELQSANEELETSKEELQSINEELQTVNTELASRVDELSRLNSDITNLLESTQIATVFLDRDLAVKSFTPATKDLFRLVESDIGRPITHVRARFRSETIQEDAERVLRTLGTIERQVESIETDARYVMRLLPYRGADNVIGGVVITFNDITRLTAAETRVDQLTRDLRERVESLETLLDLVPVGILVLDTEEPYKILVNRAGRQLFRQKDAEKGLREIEAPLRMMTGVRELPAESQPLQRAARTGKPVPGLEARLIRPDGSHVDVMIAATPLFEDGGRTRGAIAAAVDISERKHAEARQEVLLDELQHRVKNILATVSSLATRMLKETTSIEDFSKAFLPRLMAMARTHDLLARRNWEGADLRSLIGATLASHGGSDRPAVVLEGPEVILKPNPAATLGMVIHELATNAAKYGALSSEAGRVEVRWRTEDAPWGQYLSLTWTERGGPPIAEKPASEGFGTSFIRRSVGYELEGTTEISFDREGLRCAITVPLRNNTER